MNGTNLDPGHDEEPKLMNYPEAARFLGVKLGTLYSLVHQHRVPHVRLGPRLVKFDKAALLSWIETCSIPTKVD